MPSSEKTREELLDEGYREYRGTVMNVYFKREICAHAGRCFHGDNKVFNLSKKPWIQIDNGDPENIKQIIDSCPSGALKYIEK